MIKRKVYSDVVEINAPIETVWQVLVDFDAYPQWNNFTYRVESDLEIGSPVNLYVRMPRRGKGLQVEYVKEVSAPHTISWGMTMGAPFLLTALREQKLTKLSDSVCSYHSTDALTGWLAPLVMGLFAGPIRDGFNEVAYGLKKYAEQQL